MCFLKCLVSSSLRAKRHSQPSHEHLYGFSPAEHKHTGTRAQILGTNIKRNATFLFLFLWAATGQLCTVVIQIRSNQSPQGRALTGRRDSDSTEPVGSPVLFLCNLKILRTAPCILSKSCKCNFLADKKNKRQTLKWPFRSLPSHLVTPAPPPIQPFPWRNSICFEVLLSPMCDPSPFLPPSLTGSVTFQID